jgi:hypothetical protein
MVNEAGVQVPYDGLAHNLCSLLAWLRFPESLDAKGVPMFNSGIIEVAAGLVFCYFAVALFVSTLTEAISSALKLRSANLFEGVKQLLNDKELTGLARALYTHALINPLSDGKSLTSNNRPSMLPSYIPSVDFANAMIDHLQGGLASVSSLKEGIRGIKDEQIRKALTGFMNRADGDIAVFQQHLANWFDNAMSRVSGGYKRQAQLITFVLALVFSFAFEIDSVYIFRQLWAHPALMAQVAMPDSSTQNIGATLMQLREIPLGLSGGEQRPQFDPLKPLPFLFAYLPALPGLLITAIASLFGAPFWFDLLQRLTQLRGTGPKPKTDQENKKEQG